MNHNERFNYLGPQNRDICYPQPEHLGCNFLLACTHNFNHTLFSQSLIKNNEHVLLVL